MTRVAVLASGGVDSSVALALLRRRTEFELTAYYLKIWLEDEMAFLGSCPWQEDLDMLRSVCDELAVPLRVVSLQREYFDTVVASTIDELRQGRTPSPDVLCNRHVKFGAFVDRVGGDCELVASGHYARIIETDGRRWLGRARDPVKDQTYFLCQLRQEQLARCVFPLGELHKSEVRGLAEELQLANAGRPDSQGICFLGRIPYDEFVAFHLGERTGEIVDDSSGEVLGEHRGYWFYTIGQRRGLGLSGGPWYVVGKDVDRNRVRVVRRPWRDQRARRELVVPEPNWITAPPAREKLEVKLRHGPTLLPARVRLTATGAAEITLGRPDPGIASGQFVVFYDGELCLGGGAIAASAA